MSMNSQKKWRRRRDIETDILGMFLPKQILLEMFVYHVLFMKTIEIIVALHFWRRNLRAHLTSCSFELVFLSIGVV